MNLCNPTELKALLNRHGFNFSKTLGQNFLIDKNVLNKIVSASELNENSCVLEIGPGAGTLTRRLAETGARCTAVEIDKALLPILGETLAGFDNFNLINSDILKVDLKKLIKDEFDNKPFHVIANLPYYITTPIIMQILESRLPVVSMTLMVQKEVADRMCATCGSKEYGALSVAVQYYTIPTVICRAEPHCFIPQPKVASSVVHLKVSPTPTVTVSDEKKFFAIVKSSFGQRRKTLLNALSKSPYFSANKDSVRSALVQMGVYENIRGEKLSISQFAKLSELL
ncbi:MAG: 16S rRNA (adenine(1518)-N(6)/adenine(1519)-N(6))-dimethyltransferase RsmA [Eubacteriales bacterium]|nr:16S rRNA (adenine(1518)-N(6)/adenine(1519)-N(6))-dimethyltransferase RsmA [Eubacteriales bacterium]